MKGQALALVARGLAIFPCRSRSKLPATAHGCSDATRDAAQIETWWASDPDYTVAIATGHPSGIFVLDVDGDEGETALRQLEEAHGRLPPTVEAITARGRHLYFRMPENGDVRNSVGVLGPGLDIRGTGGYVLAPPSIHP